MSCGSPSMEKAICTFLPRCTYYEHELWLSQHEHGDLYLPVYAYLPWAWVLALPAWTKLPAPSCLRVITMSMSCGSPSMDTAVCTFLPACYYHEHELWLPQQGHDSFSMLFNDSTMSTDFSAAPYLIWHRTENAVDPVLKQLRWVTDSVKICYFPAKIARSGHNKHLQCIY